MKKTATKKTSTTEKRNFREFALSHIVQQFGSIRAFARAIDEPNNTVQYWVETGRIPEESAEKIGNAMKARVPEILRLATLGEVMRR